MVAKHKHEYGPVVEARDDNEKVARFDACRVCGAKKPGSEKVSVRVPKK